MTNLPELNGWKRHAHAVTIADAGWIDYALKRNAARDIGEVVVSNCNLPRSAIITEFQGDPRRPGTLVIYYTPD